MMPNCMIYIEEVKEGGELKWLAEFEKESYRFLMKYNVPKRLEKGEEPPRSFNYD